MTQNSVVVTGTGAFSAFGAGADKLWRACLDGACTVSPIPREWLHYYSPVSQVWSPLPSLDYRQYGFTRAELLTLNVPSLLAAMAADEALAESNLLDPASDGKRRSISAYSASRIGIFIGTGLGNAKAPFDNYRAHLMSGLKDKLTVWQANGAEDAYLTELQVALQAHPRVNPLVICQTMPNAVAATLGIRYGARGPNDTACYACASGTVAIGRAFHAIKRGEVDLAIVGGVEHLSDRAGGVFMGFDRLQTLARPAQELGAENRPFDRDRSGFLFSEGGAALLVLESKVHAQARGVRIQAEVLGFGQTSDAYSLVAIDDSGAAIQAMFALALAEAQLSKHEIGYINAHGTSTALNDAVESRILAQYFGSEPKVNSTKSILGHTIGASGAFEAIITVKSLQSQTVHISRNLHDPIAALNFCIESGAHQFEYALTHSFGFGGHNAGLILRKLG